MSQLEETPSGFSDQPSQITSLLEKIRGGDASAKDKLFQLVYQELHQNAERLRRASEDSLSATELVHEVFLRFGDGRIWSKAINRRYFYAAAARAMKQILVDRSRERRAQKRGGNRRRVPIDELLEQFETTTSVADVLDLDDALKRLETEKPRQYEVVLHRYFGGMTVAETAGLLEVAPATVEKDWRLARAWLYRELEANGS